MSVPGIRELRTICQAPVVGAALRHDPLYRWGSVYLTSLALRVGLTANQVTVLSLALGLAGGFAFLDPSPSRLLLGAVLLQGYLVLDYVDGEVARFRRTAGLAGRFLEQVGANAVDPFVVAAMAVGVGGASGHRWPVVLGLLGALSLPTFRSLPASLSAVILAVRLARNERGFGEATPEPAAGPIGGGVDGGATPEPAAGPIGGVDPVGDAGPRAGSVGGGVAGPSSWTRAVRAIYPVYSALRFPFFHPNFVLGTSILAAVDAPLAWLGFGAPCLAVEVIVLGAGTPVFVVWQVLNVVYLNLAEERYRRAFVEDRPFREHV